MSNIMIDIETLGTNNSSVILSIGAIEFSRAGLSPTKKFYENITIASCMDAGLLIDADTLTWWLGQSSEALKSSTEHAHPLNLVLGRFATAFKWKDANVWANGTTFDLIILRSAFNATGIPLPWKYYNERDYRTVHKCFGKNSYHHKPELAHNAFSDATAQALTLMQIYEDLGYEL